jgi:VWFA-related protein
MYALSNLRIFMTGNRAILREVLFAAMLMTCLPAWAQVPATASAGFVHVTSRLVVLDVTVLDKKGVPVVNGLTRNDFIVKEDNHPQTIVSFEPPKLGEQGKQAGNDGLAASAPATILMLDLLNSTFADAGYVRTELQKYLEKQPERLASPTDLMVLGNDALESIQNYTHSRAALLTALASVPASSPYKATSEDDYQERFVQTVFALEQIALLNNGVPERKNILWLGPGFTNIHPADYTYQAQQEYFRFLRQATNSLVKVRASMFVFYPPGNSMKAQTVRSANAALGKSEPFAEVINLGIFVKETGGKLFYGRNDGDGEIRDAQALGSASYTLTYRPPQNPTDRSFRHIEISMRDRSLHVLTKAGYFGPIGDDAADIQSSELVSLADAAQSTIPYSTLKMTVRNLVRHPDSGTVQFTIALKSSRLLWNRAKDETSTTDAAFAAVSLSKQRNILASSLKMLTITAHTQNPKLLPATLTPVPITVHVPRNTAKVRVLVQAAEGGWLGSVDLDQGRLAAAPAAPTPNPPLSRTIREI